MSEDRFIEIETRLAFQDQTIKSLSDVLYEQQIEIDKLTCLYSTLAKQHKEQSNPSPDIVGPAHEKPPHY